MDVERQPRPTSGRIWSAGAEWPDLLNVRPDAVVQWKAAGFASRRRIRLPEIAKAVQRLPDRADDQRWTVRVTWKR